MDLLYCVATLSDDQCVGVLGIKQGSSFLIPPFLVSWDAFVVPKRLGFQSSLRDGPGLDNKSKAISLLDSNDAM